MAYIKKIIAFAITAVLLFAFVPQVNAKPSATVTIPVSHEIKGVESSDEVFHFTIKKLTDEAPLPKETTLQIQGNGTANFNFDFDITGRFDYEVREVEGGKQSTKYDNTVYKVIITSVFDDSGNIQTNVILEDGTSVKPENVNFVDYSQKVATITPIIQKKITNNKNYKDKFRFCIEGENVNEKCSIKGAGETTLRELEYDKPGVYKYTVYELKDDSSDWNYDTKKYEYIVTVKEDDGKLTAVANYEKMSFTNEPTIIRKTKKLISKVTGNDDTAQTGDFNNYLGIAAIICIALFAMLLFAAKIRKR